MTPEIASQKAPFDISFHLSGEHFDTLRDVTRATLMPFAMSLSAVVMAADLGVTVDIVTTSESLAAMIRSKHPSELYPNVTITSGPVSGPSLET